MMTGKESGSSRTKKKKKEKKNNSQIPSQDLKLIIRNKRIMSSSHEGVADHGSALTAGLFVYPFVPRFFHHIHLTRVFLLRQRLPQQGTGGSVVEFSFTRRKARVRFPPVRQFSLILLKKCT